MVSLSTVQLHSPVVLLEAPVFRIIGTYSALVVQPTKNNALSKTNSQVIIFILQTLIIIVLPLFAFLGTFLGCS